jgi:hypothetical protein
LFCAPQTQGNSSFEKYPLQGAACPAKQKYSCLTELFMAFLLLKCASKAPSLLEAQSAEKRDHLRRVACWHPGAAERRAAVSMKVLGRHVSPLDLRAGLALV